MLSSYLGPPPLLQQLTQRRWLPTFLLSLSFYSLFKQVIACLSSLAVLGIRNKNFGSGFGSGSGLKLVSNPDSNPGYFYLVSSSNIKRLPSLSFVNRRAINLKDSDPDPLVRGMDPQIRIRIKMSRIHCVQLFVNVKYV